MGVFITRCQDRIIKRCVIMDDLSRFLIPEICLRRDPSSGWCLRWRGGGGGQMRELRWTPSEASGFMPPQCFVSANTPTLVFSLRC